MLKDYLQDFAERRTEVCESMSNKCQDVAILAGLLAIF